MRPTLDSAWPSLPYEAWQETAATLHLWLQIVGKVQLQLCPWLNHSWHAALHLTARGLATRLLTYDSRSLQIEFDFTAHQLRICVANETEASIALEPQPTKFFYRHVMSTLEELRVPVRIHTMPSELPDPIPFDEDDTHHAYDAEYASRYWRALLATSRVFERFRARFAGKCSPIHYFWGSADLAVTRFSGRAAPPHPGGVPNLPDWVAREAYSHEVSSAGFWAGGDQYPQPIFYSYAYPEPEGYSRAPLAPAAARYDGTLKEFVLPYEAVQTSNDPEQALLEFLQSTYEAAANSGHWDRSALEPGPGWPKSLQNTSGPEA